MSSHFRVHCETCYATGPMIRRQAGRTMLMGNSWEYMNEPDPAMAVSAAWSGFLIDHEGHDMRLVTD